MAPTRFGIIVGVSATGIFILACLALAFVGFINWDLFDLILGTLVMGGILMLLGFAIALLKRPDSTESEPTKSAEK